MRPAIADKLASLPSAPGVYLMKDASGTVLYVGKATSLRERVRAYFGGTDTRAFVALLDDLLADIEVVLTDSEKEAVLLENELIKAHRPRFNVKLTDDKRFLCLKLDVRQAYPRLVVTRRFAKDGARYFGPYHSASSLRELLRLVNRFFQLRTCTDRAMAARTRPCLQYQIKRCPAPCVFDLSDGLYRDNVAQVVAFLEGRHDDLVASLTARMQACARATDFEGAARLRDQLRAVQRSLERQRMVTADFANRDVIGLYREGPACEVHVMRTRGGRLIDARRFSLADLELPTTELLADFAARYYQGDVEVPDEILFPLDMGWAEPLAQVLSERTGRTVRALTPQRGNKLALVALANKNAHQAFVDQRREAGAARSAVERLQRALHLARPPEHIECYDISHMQGSHIVASAVHFTGGAPDKARYRRFKIRSTATQDDFKSMYEVISRRGRRGLEADDLPDLMVIDGGKGQLAAARAALDDLGIHRVDLISLAKARPQDEPSGRGARAAKAALAPAAGADVPRERAESAERVFVHGVKAPIVLRQNSAELFLLVRARDEAHRFAITFHRSLRQKAAVRSVLDDIPGVGPKRRRALLRHFGTVAKARAASAEQLAEVLGTAVGARVAAALAKMALAAALWCLVPLPALAAEVAAIPGGPAPAIVEMSGGRGVRVGEGGHRVHPFLDVDSHWIVNPGRLPRGGGADLAQGVRGGADGELAGGAGTMSYDGHVAYLHYFGVQMPSTRGFSAPSGQLHLAAAVPGDGPLTLRLSASTLRSAEPANQTITERLLHWASQAGAAAEARPGGGALTLTASYAYFYDRYDRDNPGLLSPEALDNWRHLPAARVSWRFLPKTAVYLAGAGQLTRYPAVPLGPGSPANLPSNMVTAVAGVAGNLTPKLRLRLEGGYGNTLMAGDDNLATPVGQVMVHLAPREGLVLRASAGRQLAPASLFRFYASYEATLAVEARIAAHGAACLAARAADLTYGRRIVAPHVGRHDRLLGLEASLRQHLLDWLVVALATRLDLRRSTFVTAIGPASYLFNDVFLRAEVRY